MAIAPIRSSASGPVASSNPFKIPTLGGFLGVAGDIYTGITSLQAANAVARDLRTEGSIVFAESMRTANIILEEGTRFAAGQALAYIGSGVQVAGSALVTIAQTNKFAKAEADAVRTRGAATRELAERTAGRKESEGRAALTGSLFSAASRFLI